MTLEPITAPLDVLARLEAVHAADPDPNDVPGLSLNQRTVLHQQRAVRERTIFAIKNTMSMLEEPTAQLAERERVRLIVLAAQAALEGQLNDAPDWRTVVDGRERDREWSRQETIRAGLKAIRCGVEYFGGVPAVPKVLSDLLGGETVEHDGRHVPAWFGSLPSIDTCIAELKNRIDELQSALDSQLKVAEALLDDAERAQAARARARDGTLQGAKRER